MEKPAPKQYPLNPPNQEAYDEHGDYQRRLDRRINQVVMPVNSKYEGMIPIVSSEKIILKIALENDVQEVKMIEIEINTSDFESYQKFLNGTLLKSFVLSIRPAGILTTEMELPKIDNSPILTLTERVERNLID